MKPADSAIPEVLPLARRVVSLVIVVFAGTVMTGWLTRDEILHMVAPYAGVMVFSTALCLLLTGIAIGMLDSAQARWRSTLSAVLGGAIAIVAGLALTAHVSGINTGVDLPDLHRWLQVGVPHPGRMEAGASVALLLLGMALCLWPFAQRRRAGLLIQILVLLALLVAVAGVIIRQMELEFLYSRHVFSAMALHTAAGIILAAAGTWLAWQTAPWNRLLTFNSAAERIISLGTLILLAIALSAGVAGLLTADKAIDKNLRDSQIQALYSREQLFTVVIEHRTIRAQAIATRSESAETLLELMHNPDDPMTRRQLNAIAASWLPVGFSGVAFHGADGNRLARAGAFVGQPEHALPLGSLRRGRLLWKNGFYLQLQTTVFHDDKMVGNVLTEQFLPALTEVLMDMKVFSESGEVELCGRVEGRASCFPTRLNGTPYTYPVAAEHQPYPIYRALAGETGSGYGRDLRGVRVFAAHAPVGNYGLGIVLNVSVSELAAPARDHIEKTLPAVLLIVIVGIALLNYLVHPLATRLATSEQQLQLALDNSGLALWDWDTRGNVVYLSEQWQQMLGGEPVATRVTFKQLEQMVHPDDFPALAEKLRSALKDGSGYEVDHRVRTHAGEWKWIHSVGKVVQRNSAGAVQRMIGTNADITLRKQGEEKLTFQAQHDTLTGLPNRALFHDRLVRAMARSRRGDALMAVMYLDIDHFKRINDSYGHAMGDALLKEFAERLQSCVRSVDTVARLGGDEYAVILEALSGEEDGRTIAGKIVSVMQPEFALDNRTLSITTSVGVAFHHGAQEISAGDLVKKADEALYAAKGAGRNNYQIATS